MKPMERHLSLAARFRGAVVSPERGLSHSHWPLSPHSLGSEAFDSAEISQTADFHGRNREIAASGRFSDHGVVE
jgi:hypothetical protein